jgi:hypothetical protein
MSAVDDLISDLTKYRLYEPSPNIPSPPLLANVDLVIKALQELQSASSSSSSSLVAPLGALETGDNSGDYIEPITIPGTSGTNGNDGLSIIGPPGFDGEDAQEPLHIPGMPGADGSPGSIGPPGLDADDPQEPLMIQGPQGNMGATGATGPTGPPSPLIPPSFFDLPIEIIDDFRLYLQLTGLYA